MINIEIHSYCTFTLSANLYFTDIINGLKSKGINCKVLFLRADDATLLKRFSETRRKHPLSGTATPLADAIDDETRLLSPIAANADMFIDTSRTNVHQLRDLVMEFQGKSGSNRVSLLLRSFGFKHGIPADADFVFDLRCLPNPYWNLHLRHLTGLDDDVIRFLLSELEDRCRKEWEIAYMELDVSAHAPRMQRTALQLGFVHPRPDQVVVLDE